MSLLRTAARSVAAVALATAATPWVATAPAAAAATTVPAPGAGPSATVSVSKTTSLGNEAVTVRWSGFTPSSAQQLQNGGDTFDTSTTNPVRVYECRGTDPASSSDCYGSPGFRGVPASGSEPAVPAVPAFTYPGQTDAYAAQPDGPANWQDVATSPDGTGQVTVQVFTRREAPSLGCDQSRPCSIVVVPNYGRASGTGAVEDQLDAPWAWARRTVVPLSFLPLDDTCPFGGTSLAVEGSPAAARLLASWRGAACTSDAPVTLDYTAIGEPQTRGDVTGALTDAGLVTRPLDAPDKRFAYAPLALTGVAIGFQVDDLSGRPVSTMKLNARLVAKLITASYKVAGDPDVDGNPATLFRDKEFRALNPGVAWPGGSPGNHVLLLGDLSDTTWALTRWIDADPQARAFLDGTPDEYGTHVNLAYKGLALPVSTFPLLDEKQESSFQPVQGLDHVSRQLSLSQFPGAITEYDNGVAFVTKPSRQPAGRRETLGVVTTAEAAAFRVPVATLVSSTGTADPDTAGLTAAASHLTTDASGAVQPLQTTDPAAYPLLLPVQALLPVTTDATLRTASTRFLDYALGAGQQPGDGLGQLPAGYVPLSEGLRAKALAARAVVAAGPALPPVVATPTPTAPPKATPTAVPTVAPTTAPTRSVVVLPSVAPAPTAVLPQPPVVAQQQPVVPARLLSSPELPGRSNALALVLLAGVTAAVAGPAAIALTRSGRAPRWLTA